MDAQGASEGPRPEGSYGRGIERKQVPPAQDCGKTKSARGWGDKRRRSNDHSSILRRRNFKARPVLVGGGLFLRDRPPRWALNGTLPGGMLVVHMGLGDGWDVSSRGLALGDAHQEILGAECRQIAPDLCL